MFDLRKAKMTILISTRSDQIIHSICTSIRPKGRSQSEKEQIAQFILVGFQ